eukprot:3574919-Pyramimonas_sp.AAC.1
MAEMFIRAVLDKAHLVAPQVPRWIFAGGTAARCEGPREIVRQEMKQVADLFAGGISLRSGARSSPTRRGCWRRTRGWDRSCRRS